MVRFRSLSLVAMTCAPIATRFLIPSLVFLLLGKPSKLKRNIGFRGGCRTDTELRNAATGFRGEEERSRMKVGVTNSCQRARGISSNGCLPNHAPSPSSYSGWSGSFTCYRPASQTCRRPLGNVHPVPRALWLLCAGRTRRSVAARASVRLDAPRAP